MMTGKESSKDNRTWFKSKKHCNKNFLLLNLACVQDRKYILHITQETKNSRKLTNDHAM